jgi:hypothetical protein
MTDKIKIDDYFLPAIYRGEGAAPTVGAAPSPRIRPVLSGAEA